MHTLPEYDAIVIGLGPGGATAARELARRGLRVLALEKQRMPRYKTCGGCLSGKIRPLLDDDVDAVIEAEITRVIVTFRGQNEIVVESDTPIAYMVMRDRFDHYLAQKAAAAGAVIHEGEPVKAILRHADHFEVVTSQGRYHSHFVVGADGVNGISRRALGYPPPKHLAVALEGEARIVPERFEQMHGTVRLDIGDIPYGYGWIFPKKDHWSLGVGTVQALEEHPKQLYRTFITHQYVDEAIEHEDRRGFRIPLYSASPSPIADDGSLLVGDAASLVDPFLGEGIYYAIRSGGFAAEAIEAALRNGRRDLSQYQQTVEREMYPEFEAAARIARFAYQFPKLGFTLFKLQPEYARAFVNILQGATSYREYWQECHTAAKLGLFDFLKLLGRPPKSVARSYDRIADQYDALRFLWQETLAREPTDFFFELIRKRVRRGARLLDAGTGTGEAIPSLLKMVDPAQVIGVDVSDRMLEIARHKIHDQRVQFKKADFQFLPYPDNHFDAVISLWALETCPNSLHAVQEFLRVIRDDG
ncbi:MAG: geranylgeranyl reductase family protein, partial [candidate division KSB1 bacterium]|nr:geranylgeranyl reductase family protein [candidate division KSB1 bacterium]